MLGPERDVLEEKNNRRHEWTQHALTPSPTQEAAASSHLGTVAIIGDLAGPILTA